MLALVVLLSVGGCGRKFSESGIPKALNTGALLRAAGTAQGIAFSGVGSGEGRTTSAVESHGDFHVTIASGTRGQLLAAFRSEVKRQIEGTGGQIVGTEDTVGGETDLRVFSYTYSWGGNDGIVRVHSFDGANGHIEITLFCYEHRQ